jgi:hypothetical protein
MISRALAILYFFLAFMFLYSMAYAQEHHAQFHPHYQNWVSQGGKNCCDNQDCGQLLEENERETPAGIEVRIEGRWCPVKPEHYLQKGNAPNWASSHVCVVKNMPYMPPLGPCERLLCYQPKPGI